MLSDQIVHNFRTFLVSSWPSVSTVLEQLDWDEWPYFLEEWMQANWEFIVEKQILEPGSFLTPYGYNSSSKCRFSDKGEVLTHKIMCKDIKTELCYRFLCFVSNKEGKFVIEPPFNLADVENIQDRSRMTISLDDVYFYLEEIK